MIPHSKRTSTSHSVDRVSTIVELLSTCIKVSISCQSFYFMISGCLQDAVLVLKNRKYSLRPIIAAIRTDIGFRLGSLRDIVPMHRPPCQLRKADHAFDVGERDSLLRPLSCAAGSHGRWRTTTRESTLWIGVLTPLVRWRRFDLGNAIWQLWLETALRRPREIFPSVVDGGVFRRRLS